MVKFEFGKWNVLYGLSVTVGWGFWQINNEMSVHAFDFAVSKHFGIIPEYFYCYAGVGIGVGTAQQKLKPEIISYLSKGDKENVTSTQFQWHGLVGVRFVVSDISLFGEVDYMGLTFDKWNYSVKYNDKEGKEKTDYLNVMNHLVPYPKLSVSGPNFRIGLAYNIRGLTRLFWVF